MMNERIKKLAEQAEEDTRIKHVNAYWRMQDELAEDATWREKFAMLIIKECIDCCKQVAEDADAMKNSKYLTEAGKMLYEGMWGGASNSSIAIKNKFGIQ